MAVYRYVQITFWQDNFILDLTPEEKYFYLYLMTNSKTNQIGCYEIPKKIIEIETGYNRETVDKLLERFKGYDKINYDTKTNEIYLLNWHKFNWTKSPKVVTRLFSEWEGIKSECFKGVLQSQLQGYGYTMDSLWIPNRKEKEKEKEKENKKNNKNKIKDTVSADAPTSDPNNKKPSIKEQIKSYTDNPDLREALEGFVEMRKKLKKPLIERALELQFAKLDKLATSDEDKLEIINNSVANSWQGLFALKEGNGQYGESKQFAKQDNKPASNWGLSVTRL